MMLTQTIHNLIGFSLLFITHQIFLKKLMNEFYQEERKTHNVSKMVKKGLAMTVVSLPISLAILYVLGML